MAPIPSDLLYLEIAYEPLELTAHRRGKSGPEPRANGPKERYAPKCRPEDAPTLEPLSAVTADGLEAEACEDPACFGKDLAAGQPTFRRLVASVPKPARRTARRLASVK